MSQKYIFLDRDGVINKDPYGWTEYSYVTKPEDFLFIPGVKEGIKKFADAGYKSVIISNQQGVGKGYFTEEDLSKVLDKMVGEITDSGGEVAGVYCCIHATEENCDCRKPKDGLFKKAKEELGIESFEGMFYIGDTERDMESGKRAGLKTILVLSGKSTREDPETWNTKPDHICEDPNETADIVIGG